MTNKSNMGPIQWLTVAVIAVLLMATAVFAECGDGDRCVQPPPQEVPQGNYPDADLDDGRTFEDKTDPEPPLNNGRELDADQDQGRG